jgi:hypothetical protein
MPNLIDNYKKVSQQIDAYTTYIDSKDASKTARKQAQVFFDKKISNNNNASSSENVQKSLKKNKTPSLFNQLINLIKKTKGDGDDTNNGLLKAFSDGLINSLPEIKTILIEEAIKLLGCRNDQTFPVIPEISLGQINIDPASKVYVPLKNLDLWGNIKKNPDFGAGIFFYENLSGNTISSNISSQKYKGYGGTFGFPFNYEVFERTQKEGVSFYQDYGIPYKGNSGNSLFDVSYETTNDLNEQGDFISVTLLGNNNTELNYYSKFIFDYYDGLSVIDFSNFIKNIFNYLLNGADITQTESSSEIINKNKFMILIERLCGKCFDQSDNIDVSGISKIPELDDETNDFYTFSDIELLAIENNVNNYFNKIIDYEDCGVVNQPIDFDGIKDYTEQLVATFQSMPPTEQSRAIREGVETILKNNNLKKNNETLFSFIKSSVESVLTPKILFPIMVLGQVIEKTLNNNYNNLKDLGDRIITQSGETISSFVKDEVANAEIFAKKYKSYLQNVTRRILEIFIKILFNILKGELKKLVSRVIGDVTKNYFKKQKDIILALTTSLLGIISTVIDFNKCKSVIGSIGKILNSISILSRGRILPIPAPLLLGAQFLPGYSSERAKINVISEMQSLGLPTENLLDGSPNRVLLFVEAMLTGEDKEEIANGAIDGIIDPLLTGRLFAKQRRS